MNIDLNQQDWKTQLSKDNNAVIIDVRTDEEFNEGHIPGAIQMNIQNTSEFYEKIKDLDASTSYYIYCHSGGRSAMAAALFNSSGIRQTYNLLGGISEWEGEIQTP